MIRRKRGKIKNSYFFVEPDEIFLDSKNIGQFDTQQFEGRIEKPITKKTINFLGSFFVFFMLVLVFQLENLQVKKGEDYLHRSEDNTLEEVILFADRGVIYDRFGVELAWNKKIDQENGETHGQRAYKTPGFSHVLGYVNTPSKDNKGKYWQTTFTGKDGLEKQYNETLTGINGSKLVEIDARGNVYSENTINPKKEGGNLYTSIDSRIQSKLFSLIKQASIDYKFKGGAAIIMDIENGEILASTSYPEYNSEILSLGKDSKTINSYLTDPRKVFLDKTISGLYTPGSIVKPFFALGALNEGVITPEKQILSTGSISIPNPYFEDQFSVFKDWKAHGWTDMAEAIAVSSDVYFYAIGGGFEDQEGIGINNLERYVKIFGVGQKTGVDLPDENEGNIPTPSWKARVFNGEPWRIGDTYNTSIGQYGFQVTPIEMVRATAAIANYGKLITPHFTPEESTEKDKIINNDYNLPPESISTNYYEVVHEGMREAVTYGTAVALNVPYTDIAAKTGTAQVGTKKDRVNSWVIGFFPYENPKYAFTMMMEERPSSGTAGASGVMRKLFDYMAQETSEYFE